MRLIDADALMQTIMKLESWNVPDFVYESINNAPTVNAYPACMHNKMMQIERAKRKAIVTCDECRWCKIDGGFRRCMMSAIVHPTAEDYCSLGERKDERHS